MIRELDLDDLITFCMHEEIGSDPNNYLEARDTGYQPSVEYIVQLRLKDPNSDGYKLPEAFPLFQESLDIAKGLQTMTAMLLFGPSLGEDGELIAKDEREVEADELIGRLRSMQFAVRNDTYHHFAWELLHGLFDPFSAQLATISGFTLANVEEFVSAIELAMEGRRQETRDVVSALADQNLAELQTDPDIAGRSTSADDLRKAAEMAAAAEIQDIEGCPFQFSADDLSRYSSLSPETIGALLNFFVLAPGDVGFDFILPKADGPLRLHPVVKLGADRYVCPTPYLFPFCIQERMERVFKDAQALNRRWRNLWERYQEHRGRLAEEQALAFLAAVLPGSRVYRKLYYEIRTESGTETFELDGLLIYDCHVVLLEVKAGGMTPPAREGRASRLAERIRALIGEAHDQVARALRYILSEANPSFTCDGERIPIDKAQIWSFVPITVSVETLGGIAASYNALVSAGFGPADITPWAVPLNDLRVITELCDSPAIFLAYVRARLHMVEGQKIETFDEISWFGWFLSHGLEFDDGRFATANMVMLESGTADIDNYYLHQMGMRTVATAKPTLKAPGTLLEVLHELENLELHGSSWVASRFLGCTNQGRIDVPRHIEQIRQLTSQDGQRHDFSCLYPDGGLSVMATTDGDVQAATRMMAGFAEGKKYQNKRAWWLFIVTVAGTEEIVATAGFVRYPHVYNRELEERIRTLPSSARPTRGPRNRRSDRQGLD